MHATARAATFAAATIASATLASTARASAAVTTAVSAATAPAAAPVCRDGRRVLIAWRDGHLVYRRGGGSCGGPLLRR